MKLTIEQEAEIFKNLATYSITETAYKFGFDKRYSTINSIRNAVTAIKNKIRANPSAWGIPQSTVDLVDDAMRARRVDKPGKVPLVVKEQEKRQIGTLIEGVRDGAWELIDKKIKMIGKSRKALRETTLQQLGTIAGIAFDKTQIIKGEATEHIAVRAKIAPNLPPEDLLKLVLAQRQEINDTNNK